MFLLLGKKGKVRLLDIKNLVFIKAYEKNVIIQVAHKSNAVLLSDFLAILMRNTIKQHKN